MSKSKTSSPAVDRGLEVERVEVSTLLNDPANVRKHNERNLESIKASLARFGQQKPIVVGRDGVVIAGNGTLAAARSLGWSMIDIVRSHLTGAEATAYAIADNRTAELAEWDEESLAQQLAALQIEDEELLAVTGFDEKELEAMSGPAEVEEDEVPEPPADPITKPGDLWILGEHRLLCGDSTKAEDVERLMNAEQAALILADPPYFGKVDADWDNDFEGYEGFLEFLDGVFGLWISRMLDRGTSGWWCAPDFAWHIEERLRKHTAVFNHIVWSKGKSLGATVSVEEMRRWRPRSERLLLCEKQHSPDALLASFNAKTAHIAARAAYSTIIDRMIGWQKQAKLTNKDIDRCLGTNGMAGHYFGRSQWALPTPEAWEKMRPLFIGRGVDIGEFDAQRREFDAQRREFDAQRKEFDAQRREFDAETSENLTDVWEMSAPHGQERHGHPTPKPVPLISKLISAHSRNDDLVCDPFLGSGTTLIAAEQLGRKCYGMEISPAYCDVIVKRWETLTGKKAERGA
jgi:DNA modification methylase